MKRAIMIAGIAGLLLAGVLYAGYAMWHESNRELSPIPEGGIKVIQISPVEAGK